MGRYLLVVASLSCLWFACSRADTGVSYGPLRSKKGRVDPLSGGLGRGGGAKGAKAALRMHSSDPEYGTGELGAHLARLDIAAAVASRDSSSSSSLALQQYRRALMSAALKADLDIPVAITSYEMQQAAARGDTSPTSSDTSLASPASEDFNAVLKSLSPYNASRPHNKLSENAVFTVFFSDEESNTVAYLGGFLPTLRKHYDGDVVIAIPANSPLEVINKIISYDAVLYLIPISTVELMNSAEATVLRGLQNDTAVPVYLFRYYLYVYWARQYSPRTSILLSDFRDVVFQSNPFTYMPQSWRSGGPYSLAVFNEFYPTKLISQCVFNSGWIGNCFSSSAGLHVQHGTVSCSGTVLGRRNAIAIYAYLITQMAIPSIRRASVEAFFIYRNMTSQVLSKHEYKANLGVIDKKVEDIKAIERAPFSVSGIVDVSTLDSPLKPINNVFLGNGRCVGVGIDQGFHNWLLHSRQLYRALGVGGAGVGGSVTVFAQGEGPVNTIGSFRGKRAMFKFDLEAIRLITRARPGSVTASTTNSSSYRSILLDKKAKVDEKDRDSHPIISVHNWNGDLSPVVHQYDRLLEDFRFAHAFLGA